MKKKAYIEYLRTGILTVLFMITILFLYLCFTQDGQSFSFTEILGGKANVINVSVNEYLIPKYSLKSNGDGSFNLSFESQQELNKAILECTKQLISSSSAKLVESSSEEYSSMLSQENSIESVYIFEIPFNEFTYSLISRKIEAPEGSSFYKIMFSDSDKDCFYLASKSGKYYRMQAGENFYSIDRLCRSYIAGNDILKESFGIEDYEAIIKQFSPKKEITRIEINDEFVAKNIFGDNFDFVRNISDSFGNKTYMYGYGQRRVSFNSLNSKIEYKEEAAKENNPHLYADLETALNFIANAFKMNEMEVALMSANLTGSGQTQHYCFVLKINDGIFKAEVMDSKLFYFSMSKL